MSVAAMVLYPATKGSTFDADYFLTSHMKLVNRVWGPFMDGSSVVRGVSGGPGQPPAWYAVATLRFKSQAALEQALSAADEVNADVPNYTDVTPSLLIGEEIA